MEVKFLRVEGETPEEMWGNCGEWRGFMTETEVDKFLVNAVHHLDSFGIERTDDGIVTVFYPDDSWVKFFPLACSDLL